MCMSDKTLPEISKWIRKNLRRKSTEKIDAAVATVMALDRAIRNQGSEERVYDGREFLFLRKETSPADGEV